MYAELLAFQRDLAGTDGQLTADEYTRFDNQFRKRIWDLGDAFFERGIRGPSLPIFGVIGPYATASVETFALTVDRLREAIEDAKRR